MCITMQGFIIKASFGLLIAANVLAIIWFSVEGGFEPAITSLLILAAITGIFVERWINAKQKRKELLYSLVHELYLNLGVMKNKAFRPDESEIKKSVVFPRLMTQALDATISSGAFMGTQDRELFKLLHNWQQMANEFNNRLGVTERLIFQNQSKENIVIIRNKVRTGIVMQTVSDSLSKITEHVTENYALESGIDKDTILFP